MMTLFFTPDPVTDLAGAQKSDTHRFARFFWGLMARGIYLPCSQFEALFISATHSEDLIDQTVKAAGEVLEDIAAG
jgi:glutamate-1-semialdehyde 2,1-aminomutase